ncbi:MAG: hypothetical protein R2708_08735 [Vicinamibacterales bacterium]
MQPAVPPPPGTPRTITVTLKRGWAFDEKARRFHGPKAAAFTPTDLPDGVRVQPTVPDLAGRPPAELSPEERDLQRYVQVVLPAGTLPPDLLTAIRRWPCTDSAIPGPDVSLPAPPPLPRKQS